MRVAVEEELHPLHFETGKCLPKRIFIHIQAREEAVDAARGHHEGVGAPCIRHSGGEIGGGMGAECAGGAQRCRPPAHPLRLLRAIRRSPMTSQLPKVQGIERSRNAAKRRGSLPTSPK